MLTVLMRRIIRAIEVVRFYRNWPVCFLCYFGFLRHREVTYILRNGIKFMVAASDLEAIAAINDSWFRQLYTPLGDEIQANYTVVDIGAHIGSFSIFASTHANAVKVYSYEPQQENFRYLTENIKLNGLENIKAFQLAVSGSRGKVRLYTDGKRSTAHSTTIPTRSYEEVNCVTLDDVLDNNQIQNCDLLKMNCEGAEYEILFSTPKSTLARVKNISLEWHDVPPYHIDDLKRHLENMEFDVWFGKMFYAKRRA